MKTILDSIINISKLDSWIVKTSTKSENRINSVGDSLEEFIANSFIDFQDDLQLKAETFSWQGNSNNPPDLILRDSDAIEIKKMNSYSQVALNSSFPRNMVTSSDPMITKECSKIDGGEWTKNIYYYIGKMDKNRMESLFIIDGSLYSANSEIYQNIKLKIKDGVESINGTEFAETKELGRVNRVDPLGITNLRIRGMWHIENPFKVFSYISEIKKPEKDRSVIYALISENKFNSFQDELKNQIDYKDIKVKNPNNPSQLIDAILVEVKK